MKRFLFCFAAMLLLFANTVFAVHVSTIYQGEVSVASQSVEDRNQALPQAFAEAIIKISGNSKTIDNPKLKLNLNDLNSLLQEFTYASSNNPSRPYLLIAQFDVEGINTLLRDAAVPIWGVNRPLILAWVESEIPNHPADIIDNSSESDIKKILKQRAEQRGIPLIFPVMDMADMNQVSVNDVVTMTMPALQNAAKRYASDAILVVRFFQLTDGFSANTKLQLGNDVWGWTIKGPSRADVLNAVINNVADSLAGRYATVVTQAVQTNLLLKITGVSEEGDFTQMMQYVEHLPPVSGLQVMKISGSDVLLKMSLRGTRESFTQILSGGQKLTPVRSDETLLIYQWNH